MSETLSSHEIEDVLSSIRRLVSEDLRPAAKPVERPAEDDKLLLTPSFRVVRPPPPAPEAVAPPAPPQAAEPADHLIWAAPGEADPGYVEELDVDPETVSPATLRRGHWTAESMPEVNWTQDDDDWSDSDSEPVSFTAHPRGGASLDDEPLARAWAERAEAEVRAEIERMYGPSTVQPQPEPPQAAPEREDGPGLFDAEESMLDDEILRDIVREIIREELAGTLGERITRNVRKLVRVEVNRALTAREFE